MNVTNKLAELLVQEASANHEQKDEEAESVINDQIDALKKRLENQGKQLHDYKAQVVHALPDHIDYNLRQAKKSTFDMKNLRPGLPKGKRRRTRIKNSSKNPTAK